MTVPTKLRDLAVSDTGFLFDPYTGSTFSVNEAGLTVLAALREGLAMADVVARLRETFDVPEGIDVERDVAEFVHLMRRNSLLPEEFTV
jgi:hypothetical protein